MKKLLVVVLSVMLTVGLCGMAVAGSLDSSGEPTAGSGMYTLSQIYDYLDSGTVPPTPSAGFQEPVAPPSPTMKTTKEIYDVIKAKFDLCAAGPSDVKSGMKFFCTQSGSWGLRTGTAQ